MAGPFLGVLLHSIGGLAAGSFYIPFRKVKGWAWESYWLIQGVLAWIVAPWVVAALTVPALVQVLRESPPENLALVYVLGVLWGIGGLTFGLSMRYLGMSLGYATALGSCAAFGFVIPPIARGKFLEMFTTASGGTVLAGVAVCLAGIAVCGLAGIRKERELTEEQKQETVTEFALLKGYVVAVFAGVMSACMAIGIDRGHPIARAADELDVPKIYQKLPIFIVILAGGFTTNFVWCLILNIKNRSIADYVTGSGKRLATNYFFAALAGVIWYAQWFFYGMGSTKMGEYDFASWTILMAFIIVFSNLWGIYFKEWKGVRRKTILLVWAGIMILIFSTMVIGLGTYLAPPQV
jgi:L-rhamnose-H+ transport protein